MAMKTTIDIADPLLREARKLAEHEGTTVRAIVERGLRLAVAEARTKRPFKLRDASVGGEGLTPEFRDAGWEKVRDAIYDERERKAGGA
jgi:hypothetical protein